MYFIYMKIVFCRMQVCLCITAYCIPAKPVSLPGVSPVPRDQCSTPLQQHQQQQQLDLHVMYSTFRAQQPATSSGSGIIFKGNFFMEIGEKLLANFAQDQKSLEQK